MYALIVPKTMTVSDLEIAKITSFANTVPHFLDFSCRFLILILTEIILIGMVSLEPCNFTFITNTTHDKCNI